MTLQLRAAEGSQSSTVAREAGKGAVEEAAPCSPPAALEAERLKELERESNQKDRE